MNNNIEDKESNLIDSDLQNSLTYSIGILADITLKEVEKSLFYYETKSKEQVLKANIK